MLSMFFAARSFRPASVAVSFVAVMFSCASLAAAGQQAVSSDDDASASAQGSQGPLVVQRIKPAGLFAIDAKVTRVNKDTGTLVGAYGGRWFDDALLIGVGGYGLTQRVGGVTMGYGGLVLGWETNGKQPFSLAVRGLIGGGQATLTNNVVVVHPAGANSPPNTMPTTQLFPYRYSTNFFVAEPQLDAILRMSKRVRLDVGAGYRAVGQSYGLDHQLRGATGSVSLQFKLGG